MQATTVELRFRVNRDVHKKIKDRAAAEHRSLTGQVAYMLTRALANESERK